MSIVAAAEPSSCGIIPDPTAKLHPGSANSRESASISPRRGGAPRAIRGARCARRSAPVAREPGTVRPTMTVRAEHRSPLATRYATAAMVANFDDRRRALLWRDLWIALADAERGLGLPIAEEQIAAMRTHRDELDLERVAELEARLRHDVMAHVHHFGERV
ncbi:MAG: hypothetical protein U0168_30745, partial [Nannocystaceae bacterium]